MSFVKRIVWILLGVVVGALTTGSMMAARQGQDQRLVALGSASFIEGRTAILVKDTKSEGCWLMASSQQGIAVTQAPASTCWQK